MNHSVSLILESPPSITGKGGIFLVDIGAMLLLCILYRASRSTEPNATRGIYT